MENYQPSGRGINPLLSFSRRGRVGLLVAIAVFILGVPLAWMKGQSSYSAEAVFQVAPRYQRNLTDDKELELQSNSQYREFVNHLSQSIRRYDIMEYVVDRMLEAKVRICMASETKRKCVERLQKVLVVLPVPDTYMMRIILNDTESKNLDTIVNAILDRFVDMVRNEQILGWDERIKALTDRRKEVQSEVTNLENRRAELAGKLGLTTYSENAANPYDTVLAQLRQRLVEVSVDRSYAEASYKAYQSEREAPSRENKSVADLKVTDAGLQALRNEVVRRVEELNHTMAGLRPGHPSYQAAKIERDSLLKRLNNREAEVDRLAHKNIEARLMASYLETRRVEQELQKRVKEVEQQASEFAKIFREAIVLTEGLNKRTRELNDIRDRINFLTFEHGAIGWVTVVTRAMPAVMPTGLGRVRMILILALVCAILTIAVPIVLDILDTRILTVGDAEKAMNMQAAAWLIQVEDEPTQALALEQCRRLASTLLRNKSRGQSGNFAFVPVNFGGEATEVILAMARSLQQLGSRVLVVDANHMRLVSPIGTEGLGLHDMLAGKADPMSVIHALHHDDHDLPVVPIGIQSTFGLQRLDLLQGAVDTWAQHFDMVLVDVPPLMHSADAEMLVHTIGQVFLVVEVGEVTRAEVIQARQHLQRIDPAAVGLIVNKQPMERAGKTVHKHVVESITLTRFRDVMSMPDLRLRWQIMLLRLQQRYMKWLSIFSRRDKD